MALLVARWLLAFNFLFSAYGKIPGSDSFHNEAGMLGGAGFPLPTISLTLAFILEVVCSLMFIFGYHVRKAAAGLLVFTLLIALTFVRNLGDQMQMMIFFACLQLTAGLLYIAVYGKQSVTS